jgi:hypothetical protein
MNKDILSFIQDNENKVWVPGQYPANIWISNWPWAPVFKDIDSTIVQSELDKLKYFFVPHRDKDKINSYGHEGWDALTLHGLDYDKTENYDQYGHNDERAYRWTEVCEYCPYIVNLIKSFPYSSYSRVRIMRVAPGGYIMPHVDGPGRIFGPLNFALTNPQGCRFIFKDIGVVPFMPGRGFLLDIGREHIVVNESQEYRYHIIIHGRHTQEINNLIKESIKQL